MQNKHTLFIALGIVTILGIGLVAANGLGFGMMSDEDRQAMQEQKETIRTAIQNNDYNSWKTAMEEQVAGMQAKITEENFEQIMARHEERQQIKQQIQAAIEAGDEEALAQLREQYGFGGMGEGMHKGMKGPKSGGFGGECPYASQE